MHKNRIIAKTVKAKINKPMIDFISMPKIVGDGIPGIPFPDPKTVQLFAKRSKIYEIAKVTNTT